jgi:phage baseplate assembly protein W
MPDATGMAFPFRIDPKTGGVAWSSGADKIREDLSLLLGTRIGERPMLRDFGTNIHSLVHETADDVTADLLRRQAHEALVRWERRVIVTQAQVDTSEDQLRLLLNYIYSDTPLTGQMIVPLS